MLFRSSDLLNADLLKDFERLTKGLNFGPEFDQAVHGLSKTFGGDANLDVVRSSERYELFIDLPGVDPETVDLTVDGRTLTVSTTRNFTVADEDTHVHAGRQHGDYRRSFTLADDLDIEALSARYEHGVLIVTIPVVAAPEPRKITIN